MSEQTKLTGYGFVSDNEESLQTKAGPSFGANFGVTKVKNIEYKENVSKEGNPAREAIQIDFLVKDREQKVWFSPVSKVFGDGKELSPGDEGYAEGFNAQVKQQGATLTHWLKAVGVKEEELKEATNKEFSSFEEYAKAALSVVPSDYNKKVLDTFFEYQWSIGTKADGTPNDKTYPTIPKNMKGGYFVVPTQPGEWEEKRGSDGSLAYVNEQGEEHPFKRSGDYMKSNKGTQQFLNGTGDDDPLENDMSEGSEDSSEEEGSW